MALNPPKYRSTRTLSIKDDATRLAFEDLAQKLEQLARDAKDDGFPSGAIVYWLGAADTIPKGWSLVTELQGRFPRGMAAAGTVGTLGGSDTHAHTMTHTHTGAADADSGSAHHHTIKPDGGHSHNVTLNYPADNVAAGSSYSVVGNPFSAAYTSSVLDHSHGTATGNPAGTNEGTHSHNLTINNYTGNTGSQSTLPSYVDGIWIRKD
jgi:hypothetical protein